MTGTPRIEPDEERVEARAAALLPEEIESGSDNPEAQAAAILAESDERQLDRNAPGGAGVEHRRSEDTVDTTTDITPPTPTPEPGA